MSSDPKAPPGGLGSRSPSGHGVRIVDTPALRVHHPADLVGVVLALSGVVLLLVLAVYAHRTTTAISDDVRGIAQVVRSLLFIPVAVLEAIATFLLPVAVLVELVLRRLVRQAFEAVAAAVAGVLMALLAAWLLDLPNDTSDLSMSFAVWGGAVDGWVVNIPPLVTGAAALFTAAGQRSRRRTVGWGWNFVWISLGVAVIVGLVTLPGAVMCVLLGRATGLAMRYTFGVESGRAYGAALVDGIRRAGYTPVRLVRVHDVAGTQPAGDAGEPASGSGGEPAQATDLAAVAITRYGDNRVYAMTTVDGERLDVIVLDGDRQVVGTLTRFWRSMRLRGVDGRAVVSLRQAAERAALLSYAAWSAGVCTPRLLGIAEAEDSMLLIQQHAHGALPLRDIPDEDLTDEVLDAIWEQLSVAHGAGLAHRALTADSILIGPPGAQCPPESPAAARTEGHERVVLIIGWEQGDVASSELARRMDVSHVLALLALRVGPERAVASAVRTAREDLATIGPLLQPIAFPRATREEARGQRHVMGELREALLARLPTAMFESERIVRFGARTVFMLVLGIVAAVVVIGSLNFDEIRDAVAQASPWWALAGFALGLTSFVGSAITLVAFSPVRLSLWRTTLVQTAAAYVALVAPAGIGPAALNHRMLTKRGVSNALAAASVGLVQLAQFVTTIVLLIVLSLVSGSDPLQKLPSATVLLVIALVALAVGALLLIPGLRQWVAARLLPVWQTTWPRLVQLIGQPKRFTIAILGSLVMTLSYLGAFYASLAAFGQQDRLSLIDMAFVYLAGNATGSLLPTPGGLVGVETALVGTLTTTTRVSLAFATPVIILFRALTFWGRIPLGWAAMKVLQRSGEL